MKAIPKRYWVFPVDLLFMVLSYFLAHLVRFEDLRFMDNQSDFWTCTAIVLVTRSVVFLLLESTDLSGPMPLSTTC